MTEIMLELIGADRVKLTSEAEDYIARTAIPEPFYTRYQMRTDLWAALGAWSRAGYPLEAIATAASYGMAKGWRAREAAYKRERERERERTASPLPLYGWRAAA